MKIEIKASGLRAAGKTYLLDALAETVREVMGERAYVLVLTEEHRFERAGPEASDALRNLFPQLIKKDEDQ